MMIYTLSDFIREYKKICDMGWIRTHRAGPTGIGKTLEDLLGIQENNIDSPDFGDYELKSCRLNSNSMLTIFTKTPQPRGAANTLRMTFGYSSDAYDNDEKVLHSTLSADRFVPIANTGRSLKIFCGPEKISIVAEDGKEYAYWTRDALKKAFEKKYKDKFIYAKAIAQGAGANEQFKFTEAYEVSGFNYDAFVALLERGKIYIDLRIGQYHGGIKNGQIHDHGTGFRIKENDQPLLFKVNRKIV
ncbi:MAG: MvaI/BcnI family restriction endonuclease [Clostridium sp.]|nr:MvaI/BcnI family restriction endonuclease [Clostridium sp.]